MADNLSINITADTASLRAQLALAQADVRAYGAEVRNLAGELRSAGSDAKGGLFAELERSSSGLASAKADVAAFTAQLRTGKAAHEEHANAIRGTGEALAGLRAGGTEAVGQLKEVGNSLALLAGFGGGLGALGGLFAVEGLVEFIHGTAEAAEKTENMAASIGVAAEKLALFKLELKLVGGDAESAAHTIQMLERRMQEALTAPTGKPAAAFEALGISEEQLKAGLTDVIAFINGPLAEAYKRNVAEAINPATGVANLREILGRSMSELVPLLSRDPEKLKAEVKDALGGNVPTDEGIHKLAEYEEQLNKLSIAFEGLKKSMLSGFIEPLSEATKAATELVKQGGPLASFLAGIKAAIKDTFSEGPGGLGGPPEGLAEAWDAFDKWIKAHSGLGSKLVPESWTKPHPFINFGEPATTQPGVGFGERAAREGHDTAAATTEHTNAVTEATQAERDLLAEIRRREGGGRYDTFHASGVQVASLADVTALPGKSHAFGAYGFQPGTYREAAAALGLNPEDISPANQDAAALWLLRKYGANATASWAKSGPYPEAGGEKTYVAPAARDYAKEKKDLEDQLKAINEEVSVREKWLDYEITQAKGNQTAIAAIEKQKTDIAQEAYARKVALNEAADSKIRVNQEGWLAGEIGTLNRAAQQQQRYEEEVARAEISKLETQRRILDQSEAADLQRVEQQRSVGNLTIDAAAAAEEQIVVVHDAAANAILAKETELAQGQIKLAQEVANRREELAAKTAEKQRQIMEKAEIEHEQRAHAIDAEIANSLSSGIVNAAWGKGGGTMQQIGGFIQAQEKKALDAVGTRLLDASGAGKLFEGIGDKFMSFLPGAAKGAGETALGTASTAAATQVGLLGTAAGSAAAALTGHGAVTATDTGMKAVNTTTTGLNTVATTSNTVATEANSTAQSAGGLGSFIKGIPLIGSIAGLFFERGGIVPSAAGGMIAGGGLSILHPEEMVLPANISRGLQSMIGGFGSPALSPDFAAGAAGSSASHTHNWNISGVLNSRDLDRVLMSRGEAIAASMARQRRNFNAAAA